MDTIIPLLKTYKKFYSNWKYDDTEPDSITLVDILKEEKGVDRPAPKVKDFKIIRGCTTRTEARGLGEIDFTIRDWRIRPGWPRVVERRS
jgi:hypothetical protein